MEVDSTGEEFKVPKYLESLSFNQGSIIFLENKFTDFDRI